MFTLSSELQRKHNGKLSSVANRLSIPQVKSIKVKRTSKRKSITIKSRRVMIAIPSTPVYRGYIGKYQGIQRYNTDNSAVATVKVYGM